MSKTFSSKNDDAEDEELELALQRSSALKSKIKLNKM
jgi:hypothetical protein